jgi:hypothetical protein
LNQNKTTDKKGGASMRKQKSILVLAISVALISLVVLMPRIVNADESVYEVIEFVGTSYSSFEDATQDALKAYASYCQNEGVESIFCGPDGDGEMPDLWDVQLFVKATEDGGLGAFAKVRRKARKGRNPQNDEMTRSQEKN